MRSKLRSAVLLAFVAIATSAAAGGPSPAPISPSSSAPLSGQLAFSDTIVFDYNRDGTPDRVQFWIDIEGRPAAGQPGDPDASAGSGSVRYFVLDVDHNRRIDDWLLGFNMSEGFPVAGQAYPITNLTIDGRTARFDLSGSHWTVTDNGDTWKKDSIEIETGGRLRKGRFYGGDVKVRPGLAGVSRPAVTGSADAQPQKSVAGGEAKAIVAPPAVSKPAVAETAAPQTQEPVAAGEIKAAATPRVLEKPADIPANRRCNRCHGVAAATMATDGGPHAELKCASCHTKHPAVVKGAVPQCLSCHNRHDDSMSIATCSTCHQSHAILTIQYGIKVPDAYCAACHKKAASRLRESGTRHTGLACVICHRSEHRTIPTCVDCHGGPHGAKVMSKPDRCVRCHDSAHATQVDR